jgi:prevent-host-death family protein
MPDDTRTISATEFKARCLEILDQLAERRLTRVTVTKRGRVVAVLTPPAEEAVAVRGLHGFLRDSVVVPEGLDLTAPVLDEPLLAERGEVHG